MSPNLRRVVLVFGLFVLLVLLALGLAGWLWPVPETPFFLGGIQVNEPDHDVWVESLEAAGLNTVSVTVYAHQGDWDSDHLWFDETDEAVLSEMRAAKARGLHVVLILRVHLDQTFERNRYLWHGMIHPRSEEQIASWFEKYSRFVLTWADVAEAEGVDVLGIASEMNELTSTFPITAIPELHEYYLNEEKQAIHGREVLEQVDLNPEAVLEGSEGGGTESIAALVDSKAQAFRRWASQVSWNEEPDSLARMNRRREVLAERWVKLIERLRQTYSGKLTYAANFDQYEMVSFWDHLDVMGINAYFQLRRDPTLAPGSAALEGALHEGWKDVLEGISGFRQGQNLGSVPVLFTELGYTFRRYSTLEPWASDGFSVVRWPVAQSESENSSEEPVSETYEQRLLVWKEQPLDPTERGLALRGLRTAALEVEDQMIQGALYWKLSTLPGHREVEPFVLILGQEPLDPSQNELRLFGIEGRSRFGYKIQGPR